MISIPLQQIIGGWQIKIYLKIFELLRNDLELSWNAYRRVKYEKTMQDNDVLNILRVFRVGTWSTVHRPLDIIQKLLGDPIGGLGQRLSVFWTLGN